MLTLSLSLDLSFNPVFKSLSALCAKLQLGFIPAKAGMVLLNISDTSDVVEVAWKRLKDYLHRYDGVSTNFRFHEISAEEILSVDKEIRLPEWFVTSFCGHQEPTSKSKGKRSIGFTHPSSKTVALIRLYNKYGLLEAACSLASESLQSIIDSGVLPVQVEWIPFSLIDELINKCVHVINRTNHESLSSEEKISISRLQNIHQKLSDDVDRFYARQNKGLENLKVMNVQSRSKRLQQRL
jgi:hypothetical protein